MGCWCGGVCGFDGARELEEALLLLLWELGEEDIVHASRCDSLQPGAPHRPQIKRAYRQLGHWLECENCIVYLLKWELLHC